MRKTISLKLTQQEEKIISSIRKKGISPSAFIREAFWNSIHEKEGKNTGKAYKEVNQVNHFHQEEVNQDDRKVYNVVNQVNQKVNQLDDFLREKVVNQQVNQADQSQSLFLDQYIHQLESELHDWKMRYAAEIQYWKETYQLLQGEYQNQVKDSTKRIDDKFDRIMFYIEESRKSPPHTFELPSQSDNTSEKQKKRSASQMFRM
jgi:hypothetical protein